MPIETIKKQELRIPATLKNRVIGEARKQRRSQNATIIIILEQYFNIKKNVVEVPETKEEQVAEIA